MPHRLEEEKIYLNALNLAFQENLLKLPQFVSQYPSFYDAFIEYQKRQPVSFDPLKEWEKLIKNNIQFLILSDPNYPSLLKEIPNPPLGLYVKGEIPDYTNYHYLAVVGTRKNSSYGKLVIETLIKNLIPYQFVIISGLALGIDTWCHKIALDEGGKTIAVLGTGLDKIYPANNKTLSQKIIENGALISEYPLSTPPLKHHFPWRNRIISGLAPATLVIEAPKTSGALITANFALEQNRDVFAVPGSIFNKTSLGTNNLIKSGAKLISQIEDILEEYHLQITKSINSNNHFDNQIEKQIYELLSSEETLFIDKIIEKTNLKTNEVLIALTSLEMKKLIKDLGGGKYGIINNN